MYKEVEELGMKITGYIHHGECFYNEDVLTEYLKLLEQLVSSSIELYEKNKKDMEDF